MKNAQRLLPKNLKLWAFFILLLTNQSIANSNSIYLLCRRSMEVRTLRVYQSKETCNSWYTKEGIDEKVADSKDLELCRNIIIRIKATLESANWKCKDISASRITE